jgi:isopenicillin N synthase-like dioxygenase
MNNVSTTPLAEIALEAKLGQLGKEVSTREIPLIDLSDFEARRAEITDQLWQAATECGFFQLCNHGIPVYVIEDAFAMAEQFFALPDSEKGKYPLLGATNAGWESKAQVRPATRTADQKESYQITRSRMNALWPAEALPQLRNTLLGFESQAWQVGMRVLSCLGERLGFARHFFSQAHDPSAESYQCTLRLLHYFALEERFDVNKKLWRAGAHTDFDCLTLLFQQTGQGGLQVCPGKEALSNEWTPVVPQTGIITCNIGDMLMRWSDDKLKSTLHRVCMPGPEDYQGSRYSIGFFCQANKEVIIQGPLKKYDPISAGDYQTLRVSANFAKLNPPPKPQT